MLWSASAASSSAAGDGSRDEEPPGSGRVRAINLTLEVERETDGRWIAEVVEIPGVLAYGETEDAAVGAAEALALRVIADRIEHGELGPGLLHVEFMAA